MNTELLQFKPEYKPDQANQAQQDSKDAFMKEFLEDMAKGFAAGVSKMPYPFASALEEPAKGGSKSGQVKDSDSPARNTVTGDTRPRPTTENKRDKSNEAHSAPSEHQRPVTPQEFSPRREHAPIKPPHETVPNQHQNTCRLRFSW